MDGREATLAVRKYFEEAHGLFGVRGFRVEAVKHLAEQERWAVKCSFYPGMHARQEVSYEVLVSDDGEIVEVKRLDAKEPTA